MDVINQIQLPPALQGYSLTTIALSIFMILVFLSVFVSLSAFITNAPHSSFFRALIGTLLHTTLIVVAVLFLISIREPPTGETILGIAFVSAVIAFATSFSCSYAKGAAITCVAGIMYFMVYKCLILFLQTQEPEIYIKYSETVSSLITQYQFYR